MDSQMSPCDADDGAGPTVPTPAQPAPPPAEETPDDGRQDWILPADLQTALVRMLTDIMNGISPNDRPVSSRTQVMAANVLATVSQLNIDQAKIDRASKEA